MTTPSAPALAVSLKPDGSLDADKLLTAFLAFWRQHGQPLRGSVHYHEVAAQLVMMAFLHRVVNPVLSEVEGGIGTRIACSSSEMTDGVGQHPLQPSL